jgi:hypothetical protein
MTLEQQEQQKKKELLESYNKFVNQINIIDLRIVSAKIDNLGCETLPDAHSISHKVTSWYENNENKSSFNAFQRYNLSIVNKETRKKVVKLLVSFCVTYSSKIPMSDEYMSIFENTSLQLNTWPYFREFTHNSLSRMGLPSVVAPSYKMMSAKQ